MKLVEIKNWSDERLITQNTPDRNGYNSMIVEELYERIKHGILAKDIYQEVDAICDVSVFAVGEIYKYGADAQDLLGYGDIKDWIYNVNDELLSYLKENNISYTSRVVYYLGEFLESEDDNGKVKAMTNMIIDSYKTLYEMSFDADKCMDEVMKELNSRTGAYSEETKKWQKFKTPEAQALWYTADFTNCRLG